MDIVPVLEGSKDCKFCNLNTSQGVSYHGSSHRYLEEGEAAHLECYIEYCVERGLIKAFDMKESKEKG